MTISGRAYAFNHMDTFIAGRDDQGARVPEALGDHERQRRLRRSRCPTTRTSRPTSSRPTATTRSTCRRSTPRGKDIENANFQTPADFEYNALAAILSVPFGPDGRPEQCVIVTTASARNVRGVPYETFHERTPHGVPGATAGRFPEVPGPTYFNEFVIPDRERDRDLRGRRDHLDRGARRAPTGSSATQPDRPGSPASSPPASTAGSSTRTRRGAPTS